MSGAVWEAGRWLVVTGAAAWAALLAVAEEAPTPAGTLGERPAERGERVPPFRAIQASRLALLLVCGLGAGTLLPWWAAPPVAAALRGIVIVLLLIIATDLLPRGAATLSPRLAAALAPVAARSLVPFRPLVGLIAAVERALSVVLPPVGRIDDEVRGEERDMLAGVLSLRNSTVEEVMTPRLDISAIDVASTWPEVAEAVRRSEHARIPVFREDLDDILGVLYAKDLTPALAGLHAAPAEWREVVRPAAFVPESKSLAEQLRDFQRGPAHLAIVVDEFGGTSGLVTLEDVLEEVVGEIHGEYDADEEPEVEREGDERFWVNGAVTLDELSNLLGTPIEREEVSTVGGLIYSELGRVPRPGEEFRLGEFRVVVERVVRRRVHRVYFERLRDASTIEAGGGSAS